MATAVESHAVRWLAYVLIRFRAFTRRERARIQRFLMFVNCGLFAGGVDWIIVCGKHDMYECRGERGNWEVVMGTGRLEVWESGSLGVWGVWDVDAQG